MEWGGAILPHENSLLGGAALNRKQQYDYAIG